MGAAKRRGTFEQRQSLAIERDREAKEKRLAEQAGAERRRLARQAEPTHDSRGRPLSSRDSRRAAALALALVALTGSHGGHR